MSFLFLVFKLITEINFKYFLTVVVHDWLYTYVYKDVHELCGRRNRLIPMVFVFGVSAFVHEFIITFTFRFFYPILLLMFGGVGCKLFSLCSIEDGLDRFAG